MREELRVVNALIGMCRPSLTWPNLLANEGFVVSALQRDVTLVVDGKPEIFTPELVFHVDGRCLLIESKSSSFSTSQARKYARVTGEDLRQSGCLPTSATGTESALSLYFCQEIHVATLGGEVDTFNEQEPAELPLISYDNHRFKSTPLPSGELRGSVPDPVLADAFAKGVYFQEKMWPQRYLPFDQDSPELEVARAAVHELKFVLMNDAIAEFGPEHLLGGHPDVNADGALMYWDQMGDQAKRHLVDMVFNIIDELRRHYLYRYFTRSESSKGFRKSVDSLTAGAQIQSVQEKVADYLHRKEEGEALPTAPHSAQAAMEFGEDAV